MFICIADILALGHTTSRLACNRCLLRQLPLDHTHTHPFNSPFSGTTRVSRYQKGKPIWILLKQETVSGSGISWAICKSAPCSTQITTPAIHHSVFLQAGCPSCRPTNSVKALKCHWTTQLINATKRNSSSLKKISCRF